VKECQFLALATWPEIVIARDVYAIDFRMVFEFSAIWRDTDRIVFQILENPLPGVMRKQLPWPVSDIGRSCITAESGRIQKKTLLMNFLEAWLGSESVTAAYGPVATWVDDYHPNRPKLPLVSELRSYLPQDFSSRSLLESLGVECRNKVHGCQTTFADAKGEKAHIAFQICKHAACHTTDSQDGKCVECRNRLMAVTQHS